MNIIIKSGEVKKISSEILEYEKDFEDDIKKFEMLIDNINTLWKGADALKYINTMKEKYVVGMREMADVIEDYGTYLKNVPDAYSTLDESFSVKKISV